MLIKKSIEINAAPEKVWRVFTDSVLTREMGGEYVSEWKPGSGFGWKGKDGKMYTSGTILAIEKNKLLRHNLHDLHDQSKEISVITYQLTEREGHTLLTATEVLEQNVSDAEYEEMVAGWDIALDAVKNTAEKIDSF